ncbi:MAG TPA: MFS transporter [Vicinamibacterales bacterium]|nr:MFS transporter [Vicinamibacterales bacterium]
MKHRHRVLLLLFFLSIVTYLDRVCLSVAGPRMQADLGISPEQWGWVVGAFTLSYAIFEIPTGAMGDRVGARRVLARIVIWWSAFTSLTGAVSNYVLMLITRFLFGAGEAGAYPNASSAISRWFPVAERARAHSVVWMASRIGGALSPLLVVPIQRAYGWRASFFVFGVLGLVWAFAWYRSYRDRPSESAGITPQELAEIDVDSSGAHARLPWGIALRRWNFWKILLMYHTYCWGAYFYLSWLHTYLERGRGFSEGEMALASTLPFIAGIGGNLFGGWLSDRLTISHGLRIGRRVVGATGLAASGLLMLTAAITTSKWIALACLTLGYGSMDCMLPVSWAVCLDIGRRYAGSVGGTMNMAGQLGSFLSSVAFGYIVTWAGNYNAPLYPMAALLLVSAVFFARIDPTEQLIPADLA